MKHFKSLIYGQSSKVILPTERYCYFENLRLIAVNLYLFYSFSKMQSYL